MGYRGGFSRKMKKKQRGWGDLPPPPVFCIFLEKPPLQTIMKPIICKFLLESRVEPQTLIIPKKCDLVAL